MEKAEFRRNADDMIYLTICAIKGIVPEQNASRSSTCQSSLRSAGGIYLQRVLPMLLNRQA